MANVRDLVERCQCSQTLRAIQTKSRAQNKEITAVGYISDAKEILKPSLLLFKHDGDAEFKLSE
jgi:hypothetical protein